MSDNKSEYVGRVDQIDAIEFDREIIYQLTNQHLGEAAARCLPPDHWFHRCFPELQLVLKSGIYAIYLFRQNSTYGLDIQGLKFQVRLLLTALFQMVCREQLAHLLYIDTGWIKVYNVQGNF